MPRDHGNAFEEIEILAGRAIQDIEPDQIDSPALRRLIQDIRGEADDASANTSAYNRMHNRHNRGR